MAKNRNDFTGEDYRGKEDPDEIYDGFVDDEFEEESEEEARARQNSLKIAGKIVLGLHIAAAVLLVIFAASSGFLPPKYVAALAGALASEDDSQRAPLEQEVTIWEEVFSCLQR
jgi:flagellar basal body-associated protein FliL